MSAGRQAAEEEPSEKEESMSIRNHPVVSNRSLNVPPAATARKVAGRRLLRAAMMASPAVLAAIGLSSHARAASLYWDSNGNTAGAGATPNGTWGSDAFWNGALDGTGAVGPWVDGSVAVFSAGSDATSSSVTVTGNQTAEQIVFEEG